jgi:hypothetical protein
MSINYEALEGNTAYLDGLKMDQLFGWDTTKNALIYYDQFVALHHIMSMDTSNNVTNSGGVQSIPLKNNGWIGVGSAQSKLAFTTAGDVDLYNTVSSQKINITTNAGTVKILDSSAGWTGTWDSVASFRKDGFYLQGHDAVNGDIALVLYNRYPCGDLKGTFKIRAAFQNPFEYTTGGSITFGKQGIYSSPTDCGNEDSYISFSPSRSVGTEGNGVDTEALRIFAYGQLSTGGELSPDVMGGGLCLYQADSSGNILSMKMSGLAHGMTTIQETDTYSAIARNGSYGGVSWDIFDSAGGAYCALDLKIWTTTPSTAEATGTAIPLQIRVSKKSGTGATSLADNENMIAFRNYNTNKIIIKGDGSLVFLDDCNMKFLGTNGIIFGTQPTEKMGFWGATPVVRQSHIANPTGGGTTDAEARTAINSILSALETIGFLAIA